MLHELYNFNKRERFSYKSSCAAWVAKHLIEYSAAVAIVAIAIADVLKCKPRLQVNFSITMRSLVMSPFSCELEID